MASGFFAVLDDIAALMDDVAVSSKIATRQTAGILGDDLAVNAEKATGFLASRELPVLWAITKGSFLNKLIIIPLAFILQAIYAPAIQIVLILGGLYLAYEGMEKIVEAIFHRAEKAEEVEEELIGADAATIEKSKVKSAIATDFILSLEIVIIALGSVLHQSLITQIVTVAIVAILATVGVYGIVALIVRMDDAGRHLIRKSKNKGFFTSLGTLLVKALPVVIKTLGIVGTIALLLVSGGIFEHNIPAVHHWLPEVPGMLKQAILGILAGLAMVLIITVFKKVKNSFAKQ
ncbi:DUF808 domain-containing protein [Chryseobacterium salipaludis]|uniref:DUF808 domain-containing protein n=1 Tax=Chryseobacterium TaxID=59732 RepID=UPI001FF16F84|nr:MULTISPECIES: DUF808 family protein [Chryseobacterium]MCJ8496992.1 DUF808 domain-containing protein [Chryseobacterium salipaludis]MCX3296473.1 DUF808 family protein [Planobacterium sp. JC490]